jgi:hypothetical protein
MTRPTSRGPYPIGNRAERVVVFPHGHDHSAAEHTRLHQHMLHDHGRTARETDGLPLESLHRFEHVEQAMGLTHLGHQHAAAPNPQ